MDSIFMSYRRVGTAGYGGRLHMDLRDHFGTARVFRDIDSIPAGTDFFEVIEQAVARSGVVLALIGRDWLTTTDVDGNRRIDDPDDFVRLELESAFRHETVVIPVLVEHARMPASTGLPPSLAKLSRMQGIELSDERWEYDVGRLITRLEEIVGGGSSGPDGSPALPAATAAQPLAAPNLTAIDQPTIRLTRVRPDAAAGEESAPTRPRRRNRLLLAAIASIVLLAGGATLIAAVPPDGPSLRPIPRVVDQEVDAASAVLRAAGFVVATKDVIDDEKPAGAVVIQEPADGTKAVKGATVALSVARSSGRVTVPRIVELTRQEAEAALQAAGLTGKFEEVPSDNVAPDVVVTQRPEPSAKVDKGSAVTAAISTGPPTTVPSRTWATYATVPPTRPSSTTSSTRGSTTTTSPSTTIRPTTSIVVPTTGR